MTAEECLKKAEAAVREMYVLIGENETRIQKMMKGGMQGEDFIVADVDRARDYVRQRGCSTASR